MRVANVLSCERVEKSEKLLKFRLDLGTEQRTVLSGIAKYYDPDELVGKSLILLANLAPRKIMDIERPPAHVVIKTTQVRVVVR